MSAGRLDEVPWQSPKRSGVGQWGTPNQWFGKPLVGGSNPPFAIKKFLAKSSPHWSKFNGIFEILKECFVSVHSFILIPYRNAQLFIRITNVFYGIASEKFT
jgi:hypothetical protein